MRWLFLALIAVLVVSCTPGNRDTSVDAQVKGNQALILVLQNAGDLDHLYLPYNGPETDAPALTTEEAYRRAYDAAIAAGKSQTEAQNAGRVAAVRTPAPTAGAGLVQIGELNLMMHNRGSSVTAGALYVSGYDPNLVSVCPKFGQDPNFKCLLPGEAPKEEDKRGCYSDIISKGTGQYGVEIICPATDTIRVGGRVVGTRDGGIDGAIGTITNLPLGDWANSIAESVLQRDVNFFTKYGVFDNNRLDCGVVDGKFGCNLEFGATGFDPNRASHGYILIDLLKHDLRTCANRCRKFPPNAPAEVLHGVSEGYPLGDVLYYDYDIFLDRSKWNPLVNELKQTFQINACYLYTTTVTPTVCVDPDPTSNRNEPCSTGTIQFKESQGAPIKVSRIDQQARPGNVAFTIYIEHVGDGDVLLPGSLDMCSPWSPVRPDKRRMNAVQLLDARISGDFQQLRCLPETDNKRIIRLENGKGQITCLYPITGAGASSRAAYSTAMTLEFGYVYSNVVRKDVIVHRT
jgi:hypothetical protein